MRIYVGGLPYSTTSQQLSDLFGEAGQVTDSSIVEDRYSGQSRGFGFVEMANDSDGQAAIARFNGFMLGGRPLTVNEARRVKNAAAEAGDAPAEAAVMAAEAEAVVPAVGAAVTMAGAEVTAAVGAAVMAGAEDAPAEEVTAEEEAATTVGEAVAPAAETTAAGAEEADAEAVTGADAADAAATGIETATNLPYRRRLAGQESHLCRFMVITHP